MKKLLLISILSSVLFGGFFTESNDDDMKRNIENERLCEMFTKKAETYKKTMRDDLLAKVTLESYEHRAELFCKKNKENK